MFAGLALAEQGYRPIILERGSSMEKRTASVQKFWLTGELDTNCNVQFGEGGAGTFSDGKLTTRIKTLFADMFLNASWISVRRKRSSQKLNRISALTICEISSRLSEKG